MLFFYDNLTFTNCLMLSSIHHGSVQCWCVTCRGRRTALWWRNSEFNWPRNRGSCRWWRKEPRSSTPSGSRTTCYRARCTNTLTTRDLSEQNINQGMGPCSHPCCTILLPPFPSVCLLHCVWEQGRLVPYSFICLWLEYYPKVGTSLRSQTLDIYQWLKA